MGYKDAKESIESHAAGHIENWLYKGWKDRVEPNDIESHGSDGTEAIGVDPKQLMSLADDFFEEVGGIEESYKKFGSLSTMIELTAAAQIQELSVVLARSFADEMEKAVEEISLDYEKKGFSLASVSVDDPLGMFAPVTVLVLPSGEGGDVYCYRGIEGDLDADVVRVQICDAWNNDWSASLVKSYHLRFDKDKK